MSDIIFMHSYKKLIESLRAMMEAENNPDTLLSLAKLYGGVCWANHANIYYDEDVERLLTEKLAPYCDEELTRVRETKGEDVLLIASSLRDAFGHSAVLDKWLRMMASEGNHKLIITGTITEKMAHKIKKYGVSLYQCKSSGLARVKEILHGANCAKMMVLHTSPDDIDAVIATRLLKSVGITTVLYNHADHVFSYGISAVDIVCEISLYGLKLSRMSNRVLGKTFLLGIPLVQECRNSTDNSAVLSENTLVKTVLSCGTSYKYKPDNGYDFNIFINRLLETRNDVHIILVGPDGKEIWWADSISRWGERLKFMGVMSADNYKCLLKSADVYVDSHPMSGGTAFPEALLAGVPTLGLNVPIQGYTFADELRVDTVNDLVARTCALLNNDEAEFAEMDRVRVKVASNQAEKAFKEKLKKLYSLDIDCDEKLTDANNPSKAASSFFHNNWLENKQIHIIPRGVRGLPIGLRIRVLGVLIKHANMICCGDLIKTLFHVLKIPMWLLKRRNVY